MPRDTFTRETLKACDECGVRSWINDNDRECDHCRGSDMKDQTRGERIEELMSDFSFHPDVTDLLEHNGVDLADVIEDLVNAAQGSLEIEPVSPENYVKDLLRHWLTIAMDNEDEREGTRHMERNIEDWGTKPPVDADRLTRRDWDR